MKYFLLFSLSVLSWALYAQNITIAQNNSIVLLKNEGELLPFKHLDALSITYSAGNDLTSLGERYTQNSGAQGVFVTTNPAEFHSESINVLVVMGESLLINTLQLEKFQAIVYSSSKDFDSQDLITQKLFGGRGFTDTLSTSIYGYKQGDGIKTKGGLRFSYGKAKEAKIDSAYLNYTIDSIAFLAIDSGAAPGIQVIVAKDGIVIFHKAYGYQTYDSLIKVEKDMLYDFASITKITSALPGLMKLYDEHKFSLDATLGTYLPYFAKGNKKDLQFREILSHNARLKPWISYWSTTLKKNGKYKKKTLSHDSTSNFSIKLVDGLYLHNNYRDIIYKKIKKSPLNEKPGYVYSGLSFYLYPEIIEKITGQDYESYLKANIFKPIGASTITYNPMRYYPQNQMIPTEIDTFFRKTPLVGIVHDEGAAMMRGVSANAGLFGTTLDLAKLMQMYLWKGAFGGQQLISQNTMELFTACHYCNEGNRRGLGFDKPVLENKENGPSAIDASEHSFGHQGYTGTITWVDPKNGVLFIFMSNRVYPTRNNSKIYELNVRPAMHQTIYDAIKLFKED